MTTKRNDALSLRVVLDELPKCAAMLRAWADRIDERLEAFGAAEGDLAALSAHAEQLYAEIERSRPDAPVHKNAQDALKKAATRTGRELKGMCAQLDALRAELLPPTQFGPVFEHAEATLDACFDRAERARVDCSGGGGGGGLDVGAEADEKRERKHAKEAKEKKEKRRSNSPRRQTRERGAGSAA